MTPPQPPLPPRPRSSRLQDVHRSANRPDQGRRGPGRNERAGCAGPADEPAPADAGEDLPVLTGYVHLHSRTTIDTGGRLAIAVRRYAALRGYQLGRVLVAVEGHDDDCALRSLLEDLDAGTRAVLVVGPARDTFEALERRSEVRVLTLAGARCPGSWPDQSWPDQPGPHEP